MSRVVKIGKVKIGGSYPVRIKGMIKAPTSEVRRVLNEAKRLEKEGAEVIRLAVKDDKDIKLISLLRKEIASPVIADIHFNWQLAISSIEKGFDAIRLNPLNIFKKNEVREIVREAKKAKIPIRVGINSGGFKENFSSPKEMAKKMIEKITSYLKILEKENFFDIIVSLKSADVAATIIANEIFSKRFNYPLHLGVTATGLFIEGIVKSALGVGKLLGEGIGSCLRISLTAPSFWEIRIAKQILQALNLRRFEPEIISCPTCSRCEVDLLDIVKKFKKRLLKIEFKQPLRIAIMGCVVNGPGEAYQADIGVAFGKRKAAIFKKDKILGYTDAKRVVQDLIDKLG